jgi:hypothetical protein
VFPVDSVKAASSIQGMVGSLGKMVPWKQSGGGANAVVRGP